MKVLVTGSNGFIGKTFARYLIREGHEVLSFDRDNTLDELGALVHEAEAIVHLAGENRPDDVGDFRRVNYGLTAQLAGILEKEDPAKKLFFASSIQAELDNPYGRSKKEAEKVLESLRERHGTQVGIYRLPNVFGKGARPFYNSVIATWCHQLTRGGTPVIDDPDKKLRLLYVDDFVNDVVGRLALKEIPLYLEAKPVYEMRLGDILSFLRECGSSRLTRHLPLQAGIGKKLYATYISYLEDDDISYSLSIRKEKRGSFNELFRLGGMGQVSINVIAPREKKGGHYHETKIEKFAFLSGHVIYRTYPLFHPEETKETEIEVKDEYIIVDVKPGYLHEIENIGDQEALTVIWANEEYDDSTPDTYQD